MTTDALFNKGNPGFILDDDEAMQHVYDNLEEWAAANDDSEDDRMFQSVYSTHCSDLNTRAGTRWAGQWIYII